MDDVKVETETQRLRLEDVEYIESHRLSKYEPFYAIASRVIDKARLCDKVKFDGVESLKKVKG